MEPNLNNTPPPTNTEPEQTAPEHRSVGPAIGIIIIITILILGGLYFWGQQLATNPVYETPPPPSQDVTPFMEGEDSVEDAGTQSSSDDVSSIEADLEATEIDSLGSELDTAESELEE